MHHAQAPQVANPGLTLLFFRVLVAVTLVPLVGVLLSGALIGGVPDWVFLMFFLNLTGPGHVGATMGFYFDQEYRPLVVDNLPRFVWVPLACAAACALVWWWSGGKGTTGWSAVLSIFWAWQLYHYQRQNYGLLAFATTSTQAGRIPVSTNHVFDGAAIAGILATIGPLGSLDSVFAGVGIPASLALGIFWAAVGLYGLVILGGVYLTATEATLRKSPLVLLFFWSGVLFFLPSILSTDPLISFWSYASAHGAQYIVFAAIIGYGSRAAIQGVLTVALFTVLFVLLTTVVAGWLPLLAPIMLGLTMGHFVVDAKVWRLREQFQRERIRQRFGFLFPVAKS